MTGYESAGEVVGRIGKDVIVEFAVDIDDGKSFILGVFDGERAVVEVEHDGGVIDLNGFDIAEIDLNGILRRRVFIDDVVAAGVNEEVIAGIAVEFIVAVGSVEGTAAGTELNDIVVIIADELNGVVDLRGVEHSDLLVVIGGVEILIEVFAELDDGMGGIISGAFGQRHIVNMIGRFTVGVDDFDLLIESVFDGKNSFVRDKHDVTSIDGITVDIDVEFEFILESSVIEDEIVAGVVDEDVIADIADESIVAVGAVDGAAATPGKNGIIVVVADDIERFGKSVGVDVYDVGIEIVGAE